MLLHNNGLGLFFSLDLIDFNSANDYIDGSFIMLRC
ncbi:hypothetical protein N481_19940 [Pseudoalteromonas luteoviolacea S4047-1]|uniref:Uncharacterized protein n=1 Tax=Pseudoalteromonas luteoviolacea S4054 TaxID=1129367 RepID=A0A0F6AGH3_9GAMM|nr:hypothetical protein N479_26130 [Pseudoalteromonas luteoviolacea S4054]KZN71071.1 hypothetical protein N481_19940 [Pseudoalteromonas luteoviolacea S4047-1]